MVDFDIRAWKIWGNITRGEKTVSIGDRHGVTDDHYRDVAGRRLVSATRIQEVLINGNPDGSGSVLCRSGCIAVRTRGNLVRIGVQRKEIADICRGCSGYRGSTWNIDIKS